MATLRRLLRLWRVQAYLDLLFLTQDARRAGTFVVSDVVITVATFAATLLVAERFGGIGDWGKHQVAFMLGYGLIVHGLLDVFFGYNIKFISRRIGRGQLDHTLLRPHSVATALLTEGFMPFSGFSALVPGLALMAWAAGELALMISHPSSRYFESYSGVVRAPATLPPKMSAGRVARIGAWLLLTRRVPPRDKWRHVTIVLAP